MHLSGSFLWLQLQLFAHGDHAHPARIAQRRIARGEPSLQHIGVLKRFAVRIMTLTLVGMMADRRADALDVGRSEAVFLQDRLRQQGALARMAGMSAVLQIQGAVMEEPHAHAQHRIQITCGGKQGHALTDAQRMRERLGAQGACVFALAAVPGPVPERVEQTAELSLTEYLPHDLETLEGLGYAPHGMEATVENLRNRAQRLSSRRPRG